MNSVIDRRDFIKMIGFGAASLAMPGYLNVGGSVGTGKRNLPNIVFIMADDLGYGDVGVYNPESKIPTPNIDRFAKESMRFTDAHSPSAVCSPTRYGVLTGRYCWRSRLKRSVLSGFSQPLISQDQMTVAELLGEAIDHLEQGGDLLQGVFLQESDLVPRGARPAVEREELAVKLLDG